MLLTPNLLAFLGKLICIFTAVAGPRHAGDAGQHVHGLRNISNLPPAVKAVEGRVKEGKNQDLTARENIFLSEEPWQFSAAITDVAET